MENTGDLKKDMAALNTILPIKLKNNLDKAYEVYLLLKEKEGDEKSKEILEQCDSGSAHRDLSGGHCLRGGLQLHPLAGEASQRHFLLLCDILREYANKIEL